MEVEKIDKYYESLNSASIQIALDPKMYGEPNDLYYVKQFIQKRKMYNEYLTTIKELKNENRLKDFHIDLEMLQCDIMELFENVIKSKESNNHQERCGYSNAASLLEFQVNKKFTHLDYYEDYIKNLVLNDNIATAIKAQQYIITTIEQILKYFKSSHDGTDLLKTPLKKKFKTLLKKLNNVIDIEKTKMLIKSKDKDVEPPFYCQIGKLFAQGFITKKQNGFNIDYKFKNRSFSDVSKLSKYIQTDILKNNKSVRQYVNDTLQETGVKNFYTSKTKMDNIANYCKENNIKTTTDFQNKYAKLNNLH